MAMLKCGQHGLQPAAFTSPYVADIIVRHQPLEQRVFPVKLYVDVAEKYAWFWSDLPFVESLGVDYHREAGIIVIEGLGEEASLDTYARTVPVCRVCYDEFLQSNALHFPEEAND